jgi:opacity protein-like surface antigen
MKISKTLLITLALAPLAAQADLTDISWYAGIGAGGTRVKGDYGVTFSAFEYQGETLIPVISQPDGTVATATLFNPSGTDLGYRAFGGVRFGQYLGIEAGYVNLGEPEDELPLHIPAVSGPSEDEILCANCRPETDILLRITDEIDGIDVYLVGTYPVFEHWEAFIKAGVISWDSTLTLKNDFAATYPPTPPGGPPFVPTTLPTTERIKTDGTDFAGGAGFNYKVSERLTLRGEGTWYDIEGTDLAYLLGFNVIITF